MPIILFLSLLFAPRLFAFDLEINEVNSSDVIRSVSVLPGQALEMSLGSEGEPLEGNLKWGEQEVSAESKGEWDLIAPVDPGSYTLNLFVGELKKTIRINVFVTFPFTELKKGVLNGFRIGRYPASNRSPYELPKGFIEVTEENQDTFVSSHFQLKQFLCKQGGSFPKYLILSERLLVKLERILQKLNEIQNTEMETLTVMSGYRTPGHNRGFRSARFSRHMWGDAADLLITEDLNSDGKIDFQDSLYLKNVIDILEREEPESFTPGGMGVYKHSGMHGPFVHVDARGTGARWVNHPRYKRHRHHGRKVRARG